MGCPKHFSMQGGMGAALLTDPQRASEILKTLQRNLNIPITCKIRLLDKLEDTLQLVKTFEMCNISALAVHARHIPDRPRHSPLRDDLHLLASSINIPMIYNGDIFYHREIEEVKKITKCSSVMIARGAQWNASVFRKEGMLPVYSVVKDYLAISRLVNNRWNNSKYAVLEMTKGYIGDQPEFAHVVSAKTQEALEAALPHLAKVVILTGQYVCPFKGYSQRPPPGEQAKEQQVLEGNFTKQQKKEDQKRKKKDFKKAEKEFKKERHEQNMKPKKQKLEEKQQIDEPDPDETDAGYNKKEKTDEKEGTQEKNGDVDEDSTCYNTATL